jgi:hypothetical protein
MADLEGTGRCQDEEGSRYDMGLSEGLRQEVALETQGGLLALHLRRQAVHHLRVPGLVAWL